MMNRSAPGISENPVASTRNLNETPSILIVGVGSSHGDDQLGWLVAKELTRRSLDNCEVRIASTPIELLDWLDQCTVLHLVDACQGDGVPGTIGRWNWPCPEIQVGRWSGTHDFDLSGVLALANQLDQLPAQVVVWGVQRGSNQVGDLISEEAVNWIKLTADKIQNEVDAAKTLFGKEWREIDR